jgi:ADP-ribosylglycohydrolase
MIGALAGDIIGSVYEFHRFKSKKFPLFKPGCGFTDDSVMTVVIAEAILTGRPYLDTVRELGRRYPNAGYGGKFGQWLNGDDQRPYGSWGNGSAMRASPVGFAFDTVKDVLEEAERTAVISHNHPEGVKGAQAAALAVFIARTTKDRETVRSNESCQRTCGRRRKPSAEDTGIGRRHLAEIHRLKYSPLGSLP